MHKYVYNARDIAAYFKWFSVPSHLEVSYMQFFFSIGAPVIAAPLLKDFEEFKKAVYRELYYLWANGFEDERSDISAMSGPDAMALICDEECINLENYMKLVTLHLMCTKNLPYVNVNFAGLTLRLGIRCDFGVYEDNVRKVVEGLDLVSRDKFGKVFDLSLGVPDELLRISLSDDFRKQIMGSRDFRKALREEQEEKMRALKEESLKEFGSMRPEDNMPERKKARKGRTAGEKANRSTTSRSQPKGTPLEERRHKEG
ncbi:MAG: hypothetical protein J5685_04125 [Clostridiales bacterium]|nr:hypothetical protein [Clostridiales bacterium]